MTHVAIDTPLYQWDRGRTVTITLTKPVVQEVHFARKGEKKALVVKPYKKGTKTMAAIPDILLQKSGKLNVYLVIGTEDNEQTIYDRSLNITEREKPEDYIYTEEEKLVWADLEERISHLEEGGNIEVDATLTKEGMAADAAAVGKAIANFSTPDFEANENEPGYVLNRPGYRGKNRDLYTELDPLNVGSYCLVDFNIINDDYFKYDYLASTAPKTHDFYYSLDLQSTKTIRIPFSNRLGSIIKDLDGVNCYAVINSSPIVYTEIYSILNRDILSDELKEKIPNRGVWLVVTGEETHKKLRNFKFWEYIYTQFDKNFMPSDTVFKPELTKYALKDEIPVTSVNGKTGDVQLTAEDVGAIPADMLEAFFNLVPPTFPVLVVRFPENYRLFTNYNTGTSDLEEIDLGFINKRRQEGLNPRFIMGVADDENAEGRMLSTRDGTFAANVDDPKDWLEIVVDFYKNEKRVILRITADGIEEIPDSSTGIPLPPTAEVGQYFKVSAVDENGNVTAVEAVDAPSGASEEVWELLADVTLEEETNTVTQTWIGNPMRKVMINLSTLAYTENTNYMPTTIFTTDDANANWQIMRVYPTPLPKTSAENVTYIVEAFKLGEDAVLQFIEHTKGVFPISNQTSGVGAVNSFATYGNSAYSDAVQDQITGIKIYTYKTFAVGTRFTIWGVAK